MSDQPEVNPQKAALILVGILAIVWPAYSIYRFNHPKPREPVKPYVFTGSDASIYCQGAARLQLKAPKTAEFPRHLDENITDRGDGRFQIKSWVDSQNSFGAMLRSRFICVVKFPEKKLERFEFL